MKSVKVIALMLMVFLLAGIVACGGGDTPNADPGPADDPTDPTETGGDDPAPADDPVDEITVSVTPPEGWIKTEPDPAGLLFMYTNDSGASFSGKRESLYSDTLDGYIEEAKSVFEDTFDGMQWLETKEVTLDGRDGLEMGFTYEVFGMLMRMTMVYTDIDDDVYYFTFGALDSDYDSLSHDFQSFIDSVHFE